MVVKTTRIFCFIYCPFNSLILKVCKQNNSKSILAVRLKLDQQELPVEISKKSCYFLLLMHFLIF